jgi:hypothetical protein
VTDFFTEPRPGRCDRRLVELTPGNASTSEEVAVSLQPAAVNPGVEVAAFSHYTPSHCPRCGRKWRHFRNR